MLTSNKRDWMVKQRKKLDLTQDDVAKEVGVNRAHISNIEKGNRNPTVGLAMSLSEVLQVNWQRFFEQEPGKKTTEFNTKAIQC
ncbi:helix-turn-helix transcriptional regulator [Paenibacillus sp. HGH0039]|nr:helix-turn-helix transcriptional regulator [Paenibacillus sp. HGH0039]EPD80502.1 hypothetical protein HMPREF1207_05608 [Paenibacillus sp. HGH0039]